jgi:hypothetical protein
MKEHQAEEKSPFDNVLAGITKYYEKKGVGSRDFDAFRKTLVDFNRKTILLNDCAGYEGINNKLVPLQITPKKTHADEKKQKGDYELYSQAKNQIEKTLNISEKGLNKTINALNKIHNDIVKKSISTAKN